MTFVVYSQNAPAFSLNAGVFALIDCRLRWMVPFRDAIALCSRNLQETVKKTGSFLCQQERNHHLLRC